MVRKSIFPLKIKLIYILILLTFFISAKAVEEFVIEDIRVEGLERITPGTVFNYLPMKVGDTFNDSISIKNFFIFR